MAIFGSSTRGRVGTTITVTVSADTDGGAIDALVTADVTLTGGITLVDKGSDAETFSQSEGGTESFFDVTLPSTAGTGTVVVGASGVSGIATDLTLTLIAVEFRTGRAEANPAAKNYGTNLLGIVAEQSDYFSPIQLASDTPDPNTVASLYPNVIELRPPYTLTPTRQFYEVERLKGNASPDPSIPGMLMGQGELNFYLDPQQADFWLKHLLQATSSELDKAQGKIGSGTDYRLHAAHDLDTDLVIATGSQPVDILASDKDSSDETVTFSGTGMNKKIRAFPFTGLRAAKLNIATGAAAKLRITGVDHNDAPLTEDLDTDTTAVSTTFYYKDKVKISRVSGSGDITGVYADLSELYLHTLKFSSDVSEGLTLEIQEGNKDTPIIYNGMLIQRGIFTLEEVARMQMSVIANEVLPRAALHSRESGAVGTNLENFDRTDFKAVPAPGMSWEVQGEDVPEAMRGVYRIAQIAMAIDNRLEPPATSFAEDFSYPKPVRKRNRELQMQVAIDHSKEADFDQFVGGLTFRSLFTAASKSYGDAYRAIRLITEQTQLINNPTRVVNNLGEVLQQIVFRGHIGNDADGNDEATMEVLNTNEEF